MAGTSSSPTANKKGNNHHSVIKSSTEVDSVTVESTCASTKVSPSSSLNVDDGKETIIDGYSKQSTGEKHGMEVKEEKKELYQE